jgi:hypothetical protein
LGVRELFSYIFLYKHTVMIVSEGCDNVTITIKCCGQQAVKVSLQPGQSDAPRVPREAEKFRCAESGCLMREPVLSSDGKYWEREVLEGVRDGRTWLSIPILQREIQAFAKEELERLRQKHLSTEELKEAGEYISVLEDASSVEMFLNRLGATELDLMLDFMAGMPGGLRGLEEKVAESPLANIRLTRWRMLREGRDFNKLIKLTEKCRVVPELFDLVLEFILRLDKDQQRLLIQTLSMRELDFKEKDRLDWLRWRVQHQNPQFVEGPQGLEEHKEQLRDRRAAAQDEAHQTAKTLKSLTDRIHALESQISLARPIDLPQNLLELPQRLSAIERDVAHRLSRFEDCQRVSRADLPQGLPERVSRLEHELALTQAENQTLQARLNLMSCLPSLEGSLPQLSHPAEKCKQLALLPQSIPKVYSYTQSSSTLHWTDLESQEQGTKSLDAYAFQNYTSLCEVPGHLLFVTGGQARQQEVVSINLLSFAVNKTHNPMITPRLAHASVYFENFLYIFGGYNSGYIQECERYDLQLNKWSEVAPLPTAGCHHGVVLMQRLIYTLGG